MTTLRLGMLAAVASLALTLPAQAADKPCVVADCKLVACIDPTFPPPEYIDTT